MRKLLTLPLFLAAPLAGVAQAAPADQPKCAHGTFEKVKEKDSTGKDVDVLKVENGGFSPATAVWENCFADEIFVLDGDTKITVNRSAMGTMPAATLEVEAANCKSTANGPDNVQ